MNKIILFITILLFYSCTNWRTYANKKNKMIEFEGIQTFREQDRIIWFNNNEEKLYVREGLIGGTVNRYTIELNDPIKLNHLSQKIINEGYQKIDDGEFVIFTLEIEETDDCEGLLILSKRDLIDDYIENKIKNKIIADWIGAEGGKILYRVIPQEENISTFKNIIEDGLLTTNIKYYKLEIKGGKR